MRTLYWLNLRKVMLKHFLEGQIFNLKFCFTARCVILDFIGGLIVTERIQLQ